MTSAQIRAARGMLNWTVRQLAEAAGVHRNTITNAETERYDDPRSLEAIRAALEGAGVEFINGDRPGVRLSQKT